MRKYFSLINSEFILPAKAGLNEVSFRHPIETIKKIIMHFASDSLYRNSIYLMASTAIMAFFGFFFWIIVARLYTPEQVGIATALISVMTLIASFSSLGLNVGLVRFLPKSQEKNEKINSSFFITVVAAFIISGIFLLGLKFFSPKLIFLQSNIFYIISFILFSIVLASNTLVESIFVAYRSAKYTLFKNALLSVVKVGLPMTLVVFSSYGIFASVGIANIFAFLFSIGALVFFFKYNPKIKFNLSVVKKIGIYSFKNYMIYFINMLPTNIMPILITNKLGSKESAYFYIALMIANFIYFIPQATSQSMFAEGSYDEVRLKQYFLKGLKINFILIFPAVIMTVIFGNLILLAFGKNYSQESFHLLQILAISSIAVSINNLSSALLKVRNNINKLLTISLFGNITIILLSYALINSGLFYLGISWISGQLLISILYIYTFISSKKLKNTFGKSL